MIPVNERKRLLHLIASSREQVAVESMLGRKLTKPAEVQFFHRCAGTIFNGIDFRASLPLYEKLVQHNPLDVDALFACSRMKQVTPQDSIVSALDIATRHAAKMSVPHRIKLAYAVGKAQQDMAQYDQAYAAFSVGAQLHNQVFPYDKQNNFALMADVVATLTQDRLLAVDNPRVKAEYPTPIFVLGMPRSGSTLVEQILASHPEVAAAGEVKYFQAAVQECMVSDKQTLSAAAPFWTQHSVDACARYYSERLAEHAADASYVVDKLPGNFLFVGLIRRILPHAIILHTVRDPYACLWSNFSTLFGDEMHFTYDLDVLGSYYQRYQRIMLHWQQQRLDGFVDVAYEDLVRGGETAIRALVANVGLEWNDACAVFYETKRVIKTASVAQASRPLYKSSVDLWRCYADHLEPRLGRYLDAS